MYSLFWAAFFGTFCTDDFVRIEFLSRAEVGSGICSMRAAPLAPRRVPSRLCRASQQPAHMLELQISQWMVAGPSQCAETPDAHLPGSCRDAVLSTSSASELLPSSAPSSSPSPSSSSSSSSPPSSSSSSSESSSSSSEAGGVRLRRDGRCPAVLLRAVRSFSTQLITRIIQLCT